MIPQLTILILLFQLYSTQAPPVIDYISACGILEPKTKDECLSDTTAPIPPEKCCYAEGHVDIELKTACLIISEDIQEIRLKTIEALETVSTGVKLDCGSPKKMENTCKLDSPNPKESKLCRETPSKKGMSCCYVEIKSADFNGTACMEFPDLDINVIGQAVRAAQTVKADLKVLCLSNCLLYSPLMYLLLVIILVA